LLIYKTISYRFNFIYHIKYWAKRLQEAKEPPMDADGQGESIALALLPVGVRAA
jgi:hypothetical protein